MKRGDGDIIPTARGQSFGVLLSQAVNLLRLVYGRLNCCFLVTPTTELKRSHSQVSLHDEGEEKGEGHVCLRDLLLLVGVGGEITVVRSESPEAKLLCHLPYGVLLFTMHSFNPVCSRLHTKICEVGVPDAATDAVCGLQDQYLLYARIGKRLRRRDP